MTQENTSSMYGYTIENPPELTAKGKFESSTGQVRVDTITDHVRQSGDARWSTGAFGEFPHVTQFSCDKVTTWTLDFHWKSINTMSADVAPAAPQKKTVTTGKNVTDTDSSSFTKTVGAEGGAAGKGMSFKMSGSLSQTDTHERSITISESKSVETTYECAPYTTIQTWQLIATFTYTEAVPPFDLGHSVSSWVPAYNPGPSVLTVPTNRIVSHSRVDKPAQQVTIKA